MMSKINVKPLLSKTLSALFLPTLVFIIMEIICFISVERHLLGSVLDFRNLMRVFSTTFFVAMAMSINVPSGRFDMSLGAQSYFGVIVGGNIAVLLGLNGIFILIFAMVFGLFVGFVVGFLFVQVRTVPMVFGIGMALVLEAITAYLYPNGIRLYGIAANEILSNMGFMVGIIIIATIVMTYILQYTPFGYNMRAIRGSQRIALSTGINIFSNAVVCYAICGGLVCVASLFDAVYRGSYMPVTGMASNAISMGGMFPVVVGMMIGRKCENQVVGIISSCLALKLFTQGLAVMQISQTAQIIMQMSFFAAFLIFNANSWRFAYAKREKARIAQAKEFKAKLANEKHQTT